MPAADVALQKVLHVVRRLGVAEHPAGDTPDQPEVVEAPRFFLGRRGQARVHGFPWRRFAFSERHVSITHSAVARLAFRCSKTPIALNRSASAFCVRSSTSALASFWATE